MIFLKRLERFCFFFLEKLNKNKNSIKKFIDKREELQVINCYLKTTKLSVYNFDHLKRLAAGKGNQSKTKYIQEKGTFSERKLKFWIWKLDSSVHW